MAIRIRKIKRRSPLGDSSVVTVIDYDNDVSGASDDVARDQSGVTADPSGEMSGVIRDVSPQDLSGIGRRRRR
jgi:hypothetical protein